MMLNSRSDGYCTFPLNTCIHTPAKFRVHVRRPTVVALQNVHNPDWWLAVYEGRTTGVVGDTLVTMEIVPQGIVLLPYTSLIPKPRPSLSIVPKPGNETTTTQHNESASWVT